MCLIDVPYPIAFIVGTAIPTRGRSGYGVMLFTDEQTEFTSWRESETLHTRLCATASGVLAALRSAQQLNLPYIFLAIQDEEITYYLEDREYPKEPGAEKLFRQIYENPVQFDVYDYKGCCDVFMIDWSLARAVSGTHSKSPNPINDNLYKNGVIGVAISAFVKKMANGKSLGAYGWYFEKDMRNDWGRKMNEANAFREPDSEFDVHLEALTEVLFAIKFFLKHFQARIKTASYDIYLLLLDFNKTGLESYKSRKGIDRLKKTMEGFENIKVEYTPNEWENNIPDAYSLALKEFKLKENSTYYEYGIPIVYTDGACSGNGKIDAVAAGGVFWGPGDHRNKWVKVPGKQTNNRGEYMAAIAALETAIEEKKFLVILGVDTQLLIDSVERYMPTWKKRGWKTRKRTPVKNRDLLERIDELMGKMEFVGFKKFPAHSGHEGNDGADALANEGVTIQKQSK